MFIVLIYAVGEATPKMDFHTTKSYVGKLSTSILLALLACSALLAIIPLAPVFGSTGHPTLGYSVPSGTCNASGCTVSSFTQAPLTVTVPAGHDGVTAISTPVTAEDPSTSLLTIDFSGVQFSGGQFYLILSQNGFASQYPADVTYSPTFQISAFCANPSGDLSAVTNANGTFYIGWLGTGTCSMTSFPYATTMTPIVVGPIPILISSAYNTIKVYDGSTGAEAASAQTLVITPGLQVTNATTPSIPSASGPALTPVIIKGGGFAASGTVNINYTYPFYSWPSNTPTTSAGVLLSGQNTGQGWFTASSTPIVDTAQAINPIGSSTNNPTTPITLFAVNASIVGTKPALTPTSGYNSALFTEFNRAFTQVEAFTQGYFSVTSSGDQTTSATCYYYGNDTGADTATHSCDLTQPVVTYVFSPVIIAGENFSVSSPVSFWIESNELSVIAGSATTTADGSFNATVEIPVIHMGTYNLIVNNDDVNYTFSVDVNPTIVLNDSVTHTNEGPASNPSSTVSVYLYGFPASTNTWIYWNATSITSATWYRELNLTTTASGETNTAETYWFTVPQAYGGLHEVAACTTDHGPTFTGAVCANYATAEFGVLPTLVVVPNSFNSTYAEPGNSTTGLVTALAEGLFPNTYYSVNIDNQMADFAVVGQNSSSSGVVVCTPFHFFFHETCTTEAHYTLTWTEGAAESGPNGVLNLTFVGAGFNPGVHVVSLTSDEEAASQGSYSPDIFALFTVTPQGNWEFNFLTSINASIGTLANLPTTLQNELNNAVSTINGNTNTQISNLETWISTTVTNAVNGAVSSINSHTDTDMTTLASDVSTDVNNAVSTIDSNTNSAVTTITTAISNAQTAINSHTDTDTANVSTVGSDASSIMNAVNTEQTYVLVVAVLAAIILVLVLAVLIRKLS